MILPPTRAFAGNNIAQVQYGPVFKEDSVYKFIVTRKDKAGNIAENSPKITPIRGNDIEHRSYAAVDKFFKNGSGKLYSMR